MLIPLPLVELDIAAADANRAAGWRRIARVDRQIEQRVLEPTGIDKNIPQAIRHHQLDIDLAAQGREHHGDRALQNLVRGDRDRLQRLTA